MENLPKPQPEDDSNFDESDAALFEIDALTYRIMEGNPGLSYEEAEKKARQTTKESKEEESREAN